MGLLVPTSIMNLSLPCMLEAETNKVCLLAPQSDNGSVLPCTLEAEAVNNKMCL